MQQQVKRNSVIYMKHAILSASYPIILNGCFDSTMVSLVEFIITHKFQHIRLINMEFKPTKTHKGCMGEYIAAADPESPYINKEDVVVICTGHSTREVLRTIIHEFRHAEQTHYKLFPTRKELHQKLGDNYGPDAVKKLRRKKEKDARDYEIPTLNEFEALKDL